MRKGKMPSDRVIAVERAIARSPKKIRDLVARGFVTLRAAAMLGPQRAPEETIRRNEEIASEVWALVEKRKTAAMAPKWIKGETELLILRRLGREPRGARSEVIRATPDSLARAVAKLDQNGRATFIKTLTAAGVALHTGGE